MKKHAALFLALLCALSLCAPALAYTNNAAPRQGASPYTVDIHLVEYSGDDRLSNWLSMPPADRGYAKNEVIAAVGALTVPANHSVYSDHYQYLEFASENISLDVAENKPHNRVLGQRKYELTSNMQASVPDWLDDDWNISADADGMQHFLHPESAEAAAARPRSVITADPKSAIPVSSTEKTYRFLIFGKVLGGDARLSFGLIRSERWISADFWNNAAAGWNTIAPHITLAAATPGWGMTLTEDLVLYAQTLAGGALYYVFENLRESLGFLIENTSAASASTPGQLLFAIETGAWGKTERLYMYPHGAGAGKTEYRVHVEPSTRELVFIITKNPPAGKATNDQVKLGTAGYNSLLAFYKEWFEGKLGFTAYNEGNLLTEDDWNAIADAAIDMTETVEIAPWTPYVVVPDTIVTDPPKTGSAPLYAVYGVLLAACAAGLWVCGRRARNS